MNQLTFAQPLARIRTWRRAYWSLFVLVGAGLFVAVGSAPPSWSIAAPLLVVFVGGGAVQVADLLMRQLECPRCRHPFFRSSSKVFGVSAEGWAYWARRCANCE